MGERPGAGATHAIADGIARVFAAPAVLAGTIALVLFYDPATLDARHAAGALLIATFLSGGIVDRYARRRPTRARGFFAACGAHVGAMLRIWLIVVALLAGFHAIVGDGFENPYIHKGGFIIAILLSIVIVFAQVRVGVEDRRSAIGALIAAGRFVVRNPAALAVGALAVIALLSATLASERTGTRVPAELWIAADTFLVLAWFASAVSLFQSRLAHAGYTAAPPLLWPDSPAAEAIANASPTLTP